MWRMLHLSRVSAPSRTDIRHFCCHVNILGATWYRENGIEICRLVGQHLLVISISGFVNHIQLSRIPLYYRISCSEKSFSRGRIIIDRTPKYFGCLLERKRKSQFCWQEFYRDYSEQIFILNLIRGVAGQVRWPRFFTNHVSNYSPL